MIHVSFVNRAFMAYGYIQPYPDMQVGAGKFQDIRTNRTSVSVGSIPGCNYLELGRISWTFSLLVVATMIAALSAEEAGSKDNEDSVALVQKGSSEGYFLWPQIEATLCVRGNT